MEPLRVLVVDDSDEFRSEMVRYLHTLKGIEIVSEAKSAREAFMMVRAVSPDVVLLDISMPDVNGVEAARFVKSYSPGTQVVFVSIYEEQSYRALVRDVHADGFVNKNHLMHDLPPLLKRLRRLPSRAEPDRAVHLRTPRARAEKMKDDPLQKLQRLGQSVWIDDISRKMLSLGELQRLIERDGVTGVTTNPSIFEKAIAESHDYDDSIFSLALEGKTVPEIYEALIVDDIRHAAELFLPVYDRTSGRDGFASIEVSPHLAHDAGGTVAEARRLWAAVDRPNVLVKVPATDEGIAAIRDLIALGINVNITLLFGLNRYNAVVEAYLAGLEDRLSRGEAVKQVVSVASFFLSRIDVMIDPMLEHDMMVDAPDIEIAASLRGEVAIASAKRAYHISKHIYESKRFKRLKSKGASVQRLLWASTGTKNESYSDVKYIEPLIGRDTITTMPLGTLRAYRDHGAPSARLGTGIRRARNVFQQLIALGFDMDSITRRLEEEGEQKFVVAFDQLMSVLTDRRNALMQRRVQSENN